ncbi:MAG: DUF1844 domain-containing protein [Nitrospinota bacterium]|nr:DUF1844 domain-containing protein [Nitrospinota bacterium]
MPSASNEKEEGTFSFVDKRHRHEEQEDVQESRPVTQDESADEGPSADEGLYSAEEEELKAPPIDFSTFVLSLASNAVYSLGGFQDPVSGKTSVNLSQAKQAIDILSMIEEKTRGNLNEEEAKLIKHLLYDLRMKFVEATKK